MVSHRAWVCVLVEIKAFITCSDIAQILYNFGLFVKYLDNNLK